MRRSSRPSSSAACAHPQSRRLDARKAATYHDGFRWILRCARSPRDLTRQAGRAIEQQLIDGRYTVIERLGKGAMGIVYKAHDSVLDRLVAVKQMVAELDDDPQLRQRFSQEARSAARLNHPHIITIYEFHESDNQLYIVMELLEGVDLATLMKRKVALPLEAKLNLMAQVCDGLDYAHRKGIIHRDIKPANLHVSPAGTVKILDFGIARLAQSKMTSTGGLIGTPDYMSPEQVMAAAIDARSDLFAIGAVMYELLAGSKPFEADSLTALLMKIVREPHVPLRERAPTLPDAAILLVERLLQKDPTNRPSTALEVQQALLGITTERPAFDAATVSVLATAVTEETLRPRTPAPPTRPTSKPASVPPRQTAQGSERLASLAIERGRALRESGDLAGAMKVFRSVLEIAPGNAEALKELEEMELAVARITASGRVAVPVAAPAEPAAAPIAAAPPVAAPTVVGEERKSPVAPPPIPDLPAVRPGSSAATLGLLVAGVVAVIALAGTALYLWASRSSAPAAQSQPGSASTSGVPLTTSSIAPPPVGQAAPAPSSAAPPETVVVLPPVTTTAIPVVPQQPRETTTSRPANAAPAPPPAPLPSPAVAAPAAESVPSSVPPAATPPPEPAPTPAPPANSVMVRHNHARVLFKGGGYCEGPLEFLPDGLYFKTSASSDGRKDEKKIPFGSIEEYELDGNTLHIETDDKNWDFVAPKDVLKRIEDLLKANVKSND